MQVENSADDAKMEHPVSNDGQLTPKRKKGGFITLPFIIANEALEKVASYGLLPNMILYFTGSYHIGVAKGTYILNFWSAATNFLPLVGAFLSDSYLGRFLTVGLGSISSLLGMVVLWMTTMIPQAKPPPCNMLKEKCKSPTSSQYAVLISSLALMSVGAGGIRPCSLAFGADQVDTRDNPGKDNQRVLEKFFSWYYAATASSIIIAFTGIVYIQENAGWKIGFGVPAILMFLSAFLFFLAAPLYVMQKPTMSLFTSLAQVAVAAYRNRNLSFPSESSNSVHGYFHKNDSTITHPTQRLRFLNKACIIRNAEDITQEGEASNPWRLCTAEQVEELKRLIRVMPLWSSAIVMSLNVIQTSFPLLQAKSMDRHITSGFQYPAGSFAIFTIGGAVGWIILYDRVLLPVASKIRGKPVRVGIKTRMGLGLICTFLAMVVSATVEHFRRRKAIASGYLNNPAGVVAMSVMWLVPQHILNGMAEAFLGVAQNEFYYSELPKSMSSMAAALNGLAFAVGSLLANFVISMVDNLTKRGGKESWISNDINKGHYESYYWLLAIISSLNFLYFLVCCWAYGPCAGEGPFQIKDLKEQELPTMDSGAENGGEAIKEGKI